MSDPESRNDDESRRAISRLGSFQNSSQLTGSWASDNDGFLLGDLGHLRARQPQPCEEITIREEIEPRSGSFNAANSFQPVLSKSDAGELPERQSALNRIGPATVLLLLLATLISLFVISFLAFLSYGKVDHQAWHAIMINGWATRAFTISALILRTSTDVQAGVVVCMLASIALESNAVSLLDVPAIAFARASPIPPHMLLLRQSFNKMPFRRQIPWSGPVILIPLLCITTILLQFSSTILVSDLRLGTLPGLRYEEDLFYDFYYNETKTDGFLRTEYPMQPKLSTWLQSPPTFPHFAEYRERLPSMDGIDDTGVLVRGFIPFPQTSKRESLRNYSGKAIVLDSRVSCQAPILNDLRVDFIDGLPIWTYDDAHMIKGTARPSRAADRLPPPTSDHMPFQCSMSEDLVPQSSLCSLSCWAYNDSLDCFSGLLSQFANSKKPTVLPKYETHDRGNLSVTWGHPYLFWDAPMQPRNVSNSTILNATEPRQHGVWTEVFTDTGDSWVNVTLCYSSWDMARMQVEIYSDSNRTEPVGSWTPESGLQTTPDLVQQMGNGIEDVRPLGALHFKPADSWTRKDDDEIPLNVPPLGLQMANMFGGSGGGSESEVMPSVLTLTVHIDSAVSGSHVVQSESPVFASDDLATLFRNFRASSGSIAWALSSMITILTSMAYYDQMPRFETSTKATQVHFTTVLYPQSHLGFFGVTILVGVHLIIVVTSTILFLKQTRYTLLGNYWQSLAQIQTPEIQVLSSGSANARDKDVSAKARSEGLQHMTFKFPVPSAENQERGRLVGG